MLVMLGTMSQGSSDSTGDREKLEAGKGGAKASQEGVKKKQGRFCSQITVIK